MSVNRYRPHVLVLPEDDANRELANGFCLDQFISNQVQVLAEAGGWIKVLDCFRSDEAGAMGRLHDRFMVLLIDFDGQVDRRERARAEIPSHLRERVFVLGVLTEPEELRPDLGEFEVIGKAMARDCREGTNQTWGHRLLQHNAAELDRLRNVVCPILFHPR